MSATQTPEDDDLAVITRAVETIRKATEDRDRAMKSAREAGHTWRSIALAADMTEKGVMKAVERTEQALAQSLGN